MLKTSNEDNIDRRVLTRADLYSEIERATQVSVSRVQYDALVQQLLPPVSGVGSGGILATHDFGWLVCGVALPSVSGTITRHTVESALSATLAERGVGILVGGSGLGKTTVSRAVAASRGEDYVLASIRDPDTNVSLRKLDVILSRVASLSCSTLIVDDLDLFDDPRVVLPLARLVESSRRHYRAVVITCYRVPAITVLAQVGLSQDCVVEMEYFSEDETRNLIRKNQGDPRIWGRIAYMAGGFGHPQLTHAFVAGTATRGWPSKEIHAIVSGGLSSDDIEAAREASRRSLVSKLPEGTRTLLSRLSLVMGSFSRSLALTIGSASPSVPQSGECMDEIVGPWVEAIGRDLFRVSPLAARFGQDMLNQSEQQNIHTTIVNALTSENTIDVRTANEILAHSIVGRVPWGLAAVASGVISADPDILPTLAEHLFVLRYMRTDTSIYPADRLVSTLVRLAQFRLAAAANDGDQLSNIVSTLLEEIDSFPEGLIKPGLEVAALMSILKSIGVANHVGNWFAILLRARTLVKTNRSMQALVTEYGSACSENDMDFFSGLFSVGTCNLASVERLEHIINELDKLNVGERELWLAREGSGLLSGYAELIHGPWAAEQRDSQFDAVAAIVRYRRITEKTQNWGIPSLSVRCWEAQAVLLDEYRDDSEGALSVLRKAEAAVGEDAILSRARAKVYRRRGDHTRAVNSIRHIVDRLGDGNPVERAFALRDAAVSAAKSDEWISAEEWFLEARRCAKQAQGQDMSAMAAGLGADAAVAALEAGGVERSLKRFAAAVEALGTVKPHATLKSTFCHHIIRHTVLWAKSRIVGDNVMIGGRPIKVEPGMCSDPDPPSAIRKRPLGHIDFVWYMLAEAEVAAGVDTGIAGELDRLVRNGPIPLMEISLRTQVIQGDIQRLDETAFAVHFREYIEASVYASKNASKPHDTFDVIAPQREAIPSIDDAFSRRAAEPAAMAAIIAFVICCTTTDRWEATGALERALNDRFSGRFPGRTVFDDLNDRGTQVPDGLDRTVVSFLRLLSIGKHMRPEIFLQVGLWFFKWINDSRFNRVLVPHFANWQRSGWKRIVAKESFRLSRPSHTVPQIKLALASANPDRSFIATLLLRASEAVGLSLGAANRKQLEAMAAGVSG